jgi:uncharacterized lipoprotein NlpE involved in copper resistance
MRYLFSVFLLITVLGACVSNKASNANTPELSLSWVGVYSGVTPAADGLGIEVQLTLNSDRTFILQYHYVNRGDNVFIHEGNFTWNKTGEIIILDIENIPPYYKVEDDRLVQLDMKGKRITGDLADLYILEKAP